MVTVVRITVMLMEYRKALHDVPQTTFTALSGIPDDQTAALMRGLQNLCACRFNFSTNSCK